jgi:5'-3' exonuclease
MGIPYYFKSLIKKHSQCLKSIKNKILTSSNTKLYLDFNCAIHRNLSGDSDKERILNILKTLDDILSNFDSPPSTYLAIDGVVPVAKQIQQRFRRFTSTRSQTHSNGSESWDRNQISPMTPFMQTLEKNIKRLYPWIIMSPSSEHGEGEHKIMKEIKKESLTNPDIEAYIYGLDADLIQLALGAVDNIKSINLLRENEQFGDEAAGYKLLDITFLKSILPIEYNLYLQYSTIFGNDFLPSLSPFGLRVKGYERFLNHIEKFPTKSEGMLDFYKSIVPVEEEYLKSVEELRRKSPPRFSSESPVGSSIMSNGQNESITPSMFHTEQAIHFGLESWRERYYKILFGTSSEADIKIIAESYWKTLNWVLDYYSNNETTISWKWHYPWCDPPLIQDLVKYHSEGLLPDIDRSIPSHIEQLKFILPLRSWVPCGLTLPAVGEYESPILVGYGGFLFKSFMWECHPILEGGRNPL